MLLAAVAPTVVFLLVYYARVFRLLIRASNMTGDVLLDGLYKVFALRYRESVKLHVTELTVIPGTCAFLQLTADSFKQASLP